MTTTAIIFGLPALCLLLVLAALLRRRARRRRPRYVRRVTRSYNGRPYGADRE